jgi:RNA polymerase sigma factor (TIGR02999 family)
LQLTVLLQRLETGDRRALNLVIPLVYDELKKLARAHLRREAPALPLEPAALVHEAFLKLVRGPNPSFENRAHFFGIASRLMRQVLVDGARLRAADKRGPGQVVSLSEAPERGTPPDRSLVALDDALRHLEKVDPLKAQLIEMRFFAGMTADETSLALRKPVHIVRRELRLAQAWLRDELAG